MRRRGVETAENSPQPLPHDAFPTKRQIDIAHLEITPSTLQHLPHKLDGFGDAGEMRPWLEVNESQGLVCAE